MITHRNAKTQAPECLPSRVASDRWPKIVLGPMAGGGPDTAPRPLAQAAWLLLFIGSVHTYRSKLGDQMTGTNEKS
jgi:hypothetical protein